MNRIKIESWCYRAHIIKFMINYIDLIQLNTRYCKGECLGCICIDSIKADKIKYE